MRAIKFRAWDKWNMEWINQDLLIWEDGKFYPNFYALEDSEPFEEDECDIMQYTGIDSNSGKEIYEGDILMGGLYNIPGLVSFQLGQFVVTQGEWCCALVDWDDWEVVGNIHDDRE